MAGLNISKFKKVAMDEAKSVLEHPEHGHQITIIHAKLSPEMMHELEKMPIHKAKGGGFTEPGSPLVSESVVHGVDESGQYLPCINPACKSYGKSHPNCRCYGAAGGEAGHFAKGGMAHFCQKAMQHEPGCEYYVPMRNYAEGEMVQPQEMAPPPPEAVEVPAPAAAAAVAPAINNEANDLSKLIDATHKLVSAHSSNQPVQVAQAAPPPVPKIDTNKNIPAQYGQATEEINKNLAAQVPAQQQAEQEIAQGVGQATQGMNQHLDQQEQFRNDLHHKYEETVQWYKDNPYDTKLWHDRSTPMKILSAIGMALGGAGAGISGHPEMASQAIQNAINNDLAKQKEEHGVRNTLLNSYNEQYNSSTAGDAAARLHMQAAVEGLTKRAMAAQNAANAPYAAQVIMNNNRQNALEKGILPLATETQKLLNLGGPNMGNKPNAGGYGPGAVNQYAPPAQGAPQAPAAPIEKQEEPQAAKEDPYAPNKIAMAATNLGMSKADIEKPENLKKLKEELDNPSYLKAVNWKDKPEPELDMQKIAALAHDQPELAAEARKYSILQSQLNLFRHNYDLAVKHRNLKSNLIQYAPAAGAGLGAAAAGLAAVGSGGFSLPLTGGLIGGGVAGGNLVKESLLHGMRDPDVRGYSSATGALKSDIGRVLGDGSPTQTGINLEPLAPKYGDKESTLRENRAIAESAIRSIYGDFPLLKGRGLLPKNYNAK